MNYDLFVHQSALIKGIHKYPDITFFFMIGGYGCGKSSTDVFLLFSILSWYQGCDLTFGIGGAAIKHLKETVIKDFISALEKSNITYKHNGQEATLVIGTITFVYFSLDRPDSIFGFNLAGCLMDEGDELSDPMRYSQSTKAIIERCRISCPKTAKQPVARSPFIVSTTTAQGKHGVYRFIKSELQEKHVPYLLVEGHTENNTTLDPKQIEIMKALYTPEEIEAYMHGKFINLTTGRVYAEFNDKKHKYQPFQITEDDKIIAGQDFNPGYNACSLFVIRGIGEEATIYQIDEQHWNVVGDAPRKLRHLYPNNPITLIPDASGKEIMHGWREEFEKYAVEVTWYNINPSISERILAINKLWRTDRLKIFSNCTRSLECYDLRGFDDEGKPKKGKGPDAFDHWGDSAEYATWHIIHTIQGFDRILSILKK